MIDWSVIDERPKDEADYKRLLKNKVWRLNNLYYIKNKDGIKIKFRMNLSQRKFHEEKHGRDIILKARQIGFTTYIEIDQVDDCLFKKNFSAGVIAHNREDAQSFFKDKIKFAYDNLPDHVRATVTAKTDSAQELEFNNGSRLRVGTSFRSGTMQYLHVSEYGKVCAKFPEKAREIKTGAFPAVAANNNIVIESTAEGNMGEFHDMCQTAIRAALLGTKLTPLDFKFHFFPWFDDVGYTLDPDGVIITCGDYMEELQKDVDIVLTDGQIAWYQKTMETLGEDMKREHPSTPEEAFEQSVEGAYFKKQMSQIRAKKQITKVPIERGIPIHTFWDIGRDTTSIWFFQQVGYEYRFVDYFQNAGEDIDYYINMLRDRRDGELPYMYGDCYLPHDGTRLHINAKESTADILYNNGFQVRIVTRTPDKQESIAHARQVLPKCVFDAEECSEGLVGLDNYRKTWDDKLGTWQKQPRHDAASHPADAFMTFADGYYHETEINEYLESSENRRYSANTTTGY
mgnify:CR=1 FL=1|tara:strand:- start:1619 stop:3160 length:1542 start_codon:yes stop_codon:yes gene_type:complete